MSLNTIPTPAEIIAADKAIAPYVRRTPIIEISGESLGIDATLVFKLEYLQATGAFKARGACHYAATQPVLPGGLVAASGGNHGAAVAYAAKRFKLPVHIFVPETSNPAKVQRLRDLGANTHLAGATYFDAHQASLEYLAKHEATEIPAFDHPVVMAGAGTVGYELEIDALPNGPLDLVLAAVGGGGLAGGTASWFQNRVPVIGSETEGTASYAAALKAGKPVKVDVSGAAADHLGASIIGENPWQAMQQYNVGSAVVSDEEALAAQARLWRLLRVMVEPGVAAPFAALMTGKVVPSPGSRVGVILCGANMVVSMPNN